MTKPLFLASGRIGTPPFSREARVKTGALLRRLQEGEPLEMPQSRPTNETPVATIRVCVARIGTYDEARKG
jgi:hypothetical protein